MKKIPGFKFEPMPTTLLPVRSSSAQNSPWLGIAETKFLLPEGSAVFLPPKLLAMDMSANMYRIAVAMTIQRRFFPKTALPFSRVILTDTKPLSEYFGSILELCIECHALPNEFNCGYANASSWFQEIIDEFVKHELREPETPGGMTKVIEQIRKETNRLRSLENPYLEEPQRFHMANLVQNAIIRAEPNNEFKKDFVFGRQRSEPSSRKFKPLVPAYRDWGTALRSGRFACYWGDRDKIIRQSGRGRTVEHLPMQPLKRILQKVEAETPM